MDDPSPRSAMEVMCSVIERTMPSVAVLRVESEYRALMPELFVEGRGTWSRCANRTGVKMEVMLNLGIIIGIQQQPSLLRGTFSTP